MKKQISYFCIVCLLFSFFSCSMSIEKRRYRPGFHVDVIAKRNNIPGKDIRLGEYRVEVGKVEPDLRITMNDSVRISKKFVEIGQSNPADRKKRTSAPIIHKQVFNKYLFRPHVSLKKLSIVLEEKKENGLRGRKIAAWILGGLAIVTAICSIPAFMASWIGMILGAIVLGIALLLAVTALLVRFAGTKGMVETPFVPKPVSKGLINAGFIIGIVATTLALFAFIFSFLIYPFGVISLVLGVLAGITAFVSMGIGFRALKDDKSVKTKLAIILSFVTLAIITAGFILLFV